MFPSAIAVVLSFLLAFPGLAFAAPSPPPEAAPASRDFLGSAAFGGREASLLVFGQAGDACAAAAAAGKAEAEERQGRAGWIAVGALTGLVGVAVSLFVDSSAPATSVMQYEDEGIRYCFADSYERTAKSRKTNGALMGAAAFVALVVVAVAASEE